jgi:hypothetical protein
LSITRPHTLLSPPPAYSSGGIRSRWFIRQPLNLCHVVVRYRSCVPVVPINGDSAPRHANDRAKVGLSKLPSRPDRRRLACEIRRRSSLHSQQLNSLHPCGPNSFHDRRPFGGERHQPRLIAAGSPCSPKFHNISMNGVLNPRPFLGVKRKTFDCADISQFSPQDFSQANRPFPNLSTITVRSLWGRYWSANLASPGGAERSSLMASTLLEQWRVPQVRQQPFCRRWCVRNSNRLV